MLNAQNTTPAEVRDIAKRGYIYAHPLVLIATTRGALPVNRFTHVPRFPDASFRQIVRPNADTLYSTAWLDVSQEPILIHVPDSGGRTQTNGAADYENVHAFQKGMRMMPLSAYPNSEQQLESAKIFGSTTGGTPPDRVKAMQPVEFFSMFAKEMKANPPHAADAAMVSELARIGIVSGLDFDPSELTADQLQALNEGVQDASASIEAFVTAAAATKAGWGAFQVGMGRYGTDYRRRAIVARIAVGANPPEDAVYVSSTADAQGIALNGSTRYRMHFEKSNLPPVQAFWSLTAYDPYGYFIANPINRYAIGDRDALKFNPDGSLEIYIQSQNPGGDQESNWLPSGDGPFNLTMRLYWPGEPILNGTWHRPAIETEH